MAHCILAIRNGQIIPVVSTAFARREVLQVFHSRQRLDRVGRWL
jgi:hypothetical protein